MNFQNLAYALSAQPRYTWEPVDHRTKQRAWLYCFALLIPVSIAVISGTFVSLSFGQSTLITVISAVMFGFMIGLFDWILLNNAGRKSVGITVMRCVVSVLIAVLCTSFIDMYVFKDDINRSRAKEYKAELVEQESRLLANVKKFESDIEVAQKRYNVEVNGKGTGKKGEGVVAKRYKSDELAAISERKDTLVKLQVVRDEIELTELGRNDKIYENMGFITRIQYFHEFLASDPNGLALWLILLVVVIFFDLTVVMVKATHQITKDDELAGSLLGQFDMPRRVYA